jgi:hypothetical protein
VYTAIRVGAKTVEVGNISSHIMAGPAEVEACRNELLQLKSVVQKVQTDYKNNASTRIATQKKMALMVQTVQERRPDDVPLVEDVIVVMLHSETAATLSLSQLPEAPIIDPNNQPSGRTASAEEAIAVYKGQIETLQQERKYREALLQAEAAMVKIYGQGIQDILSTVQEYCSDSRLVGQIVNIANS